MRDRFRYASTRWSATSSVLAALFVAALTTGCLPDGDQVVGFSCSADSDCLSEQGYVCRPPNRSLEDYVCDGDQCECVRFECYSPSDCDELLDAGEPVPCLGEGTCGCVNNLCQQASCAVTGAGARSCEIDGRVCHPLKLTCVECTTDADCADGWRCDFDAGTCWEPQLKTCGDGVAEFERLEDLDGDGVAEAEVRVGEECDGDDLRDFDCLFFGYIGGEISCTSACRFDLSACIPNICGNGNLEAREACDTNRFGGLTCATVDPGKNLGSGTLLCNDECRIDRSNCSEFDREDYCGNGIHDPEEGCDDGNERSGDGCDDCRVEPGWVCRPGATRLDSECTPEEGCPGAVVTFVPDSMGPALPIEIPSGSAEGMTGGVTVRLVPEMPTDTARLNARHFIFELSVDHAVPPDLEFSYTLGPRVWVVDAAEIQWSGGVATVDENHPGPQQAGVGVPPATEFTIYDYRNEGDVGLLTSVRLDACLTNSMSTMSPP